MVGLARVDQGEREKDKPGERDRNGDPCGPDDLRAARKDAAARAAPGIASPHDTAKRRS